MNIYIGNLNFEVNDAALQQHFSSFGEVTSARVIVDRYTGRSRGFGFVEMSSAADGQKAIDELNSKEFRGRVLTVNEAKPREAGAGRPATQ
ncbi:MAG: RNA-binding protein [SAR202 cluster bacterium]|nr:RNA-binding protein [SAR202 cluster bacterium]